MGHLIFIKPEQDRGQPSHVLIITMTKNFQHQLSLLKPDEYCMGTDDVLERLKTLTEWELFKTNDDAIRKTFTFQNYLDGLTFLNVIAKKADELNHHPDLCLGFKKLTVTWSTHDIGGLHDNDFICADMCDQFYSEHLKSAQSRP
jgi:4a-hydroxytetrahydrobiopterin dehydratase